jgi:molecular chaperone DnaK (HSP70)
MAFCTCMHSKYAITHGSHSDVLPSCVRDKVTGAKASAQIKADRGRLTEEDIERMVADAERYREEDECLSRRIHLRNALEEGIYRVKTTLTNRYQIIRLYMNTRKSCLSCCMPSPPRLIIVSSCLFAGMILGES